MEHPHTESTPPPRPNLWGLMLLRPQEALQYALRYQIETWVHRNFILTGIMAVLAFRLPDWLSFGYHPIGVMIQVLFMGPALGVFLGYVLAAVMRNLASLFKVEIDKNTMRAALAWSSFPFSIAYAIFWLSYVTCFFLHPDPHFFLWEPLGWVPLGLGGMVFIYALFLRWRSMHFVIATSFPAIPLIWLLSFILTYGPALVMGLAYLSLYTGSMNWLSKGIS